MHLKTSYSKCYSCTVKELLAVLRKGKVLWQGNLGPYVYDGKRELHPRRDTVARLIDAGVLVETAVANAVQRNCGDRTYRLAKLGDEGSVA